MRCEVCFRHCDIPEGKRGYCGVRMNSDGKVIPANYGRITSLALDPVEKKPLRRFCPGKYVLSVGSFGCNLHCPFCQNHSISWSDEAMALEATADTATPGKIADIAEFYRDKGNIGVAFTYNEPLVGYEFVRDTAKAVKERGMKNIIVTNGSAQLWVLEELAPYTDAMNIDLKGFTERFYSDELKGDLETVKRFIARAVQLCHVEITTLIIPGENDSDEEMEELSRWIAGLTDAHGNVTGDSIPLHITRFFPRFNMTDRDATDVRHIYHLAKIAGKHLRYVYTGNC